MSMAALSLRAAPADPVLLRFGTKHLTLQHVDFATITLWFIVTAAKFKYDELLLYPMALYFAFAFVRDRHATWPVFKRGGFIILLLPCWWFASALWSIEVAQAARSGLQVILTVVICMFIASRLTARQLLIALLIAMTVVVIRCLPQGLLDLSLGRPSRAIYPHKNGLGMNMSIAFIIALGLCLAESIPRLIRLVAWGTMPVALLMVFASQSATAILVAIGMAGIVLGAYFYFGHRNILTPVRSLLILGTIAVAAVGLAVYLNVATEDPIDMVLGALGKDRGLTGRTDLWAIGIREISDRPIFGTGAKGYWVWVESPTVRQIFDDFHKGYRNSFNFHNSWLELGVHFGLIGLTMAFSAFAFALLVLIRKALQVGGAVNWTILAIAAAVTIRTMTESDLFGQFVMVYMVLWSSALSQLRRI